MAPIKKTYAIYLSMGHDSGIDFFWQGDAFNGKEALTIAKELAFAFWTRSPVEAWYNRRPERGRYEPYYFFEHVD